MDRKWHFVIVVGHVNSTVAAAKLNVLVAHVEAGLRSRDRGCRGRSTGSSPTSTPISA
jgi:UDP-N-acetylglucosamine 2-epimerase